MPRSEGLKERIILNPAFSKRLQRPIQATTMLAPTKQFLPRHWLRKGSTIRAYYYGAGAIYSKTEDQFQEIYLPDRQQEGGTEVHMLWTDTPCLTTCWNDGNSTIEAFRNKKIEFIVAQHPWLENAACLRTSSCLQTRRWKWTTS